MPGMTDQQQRDMEAQLRADLAAARRARDKAKARRQEMAATLDAACTDAAALAVERDAFRIRLESAEKERDRLRAAGRRALDLLRCGYTINHRVDDAIEHLRAACERSEG